MNPLFAFLMGRTLAEAAEWFKQAVWAIATERGDDADAAWQAFREGFLEALGWADAGAAADLRARGIRQLIRVPDPETATLARVEQDNPWYREHREQSGGLMEQRAKWVAEVGRTHAIEHRKAIAAAVNGRDSVPMHWLRRQKRDALGEVVNVSEQIQLAQPEIGPLFPIVGYYTREDARVRPTHAAMHGFLARRDWVGWPVVRPRNGFNCRCWVRYYSRRESIDHGWAGLDGSPLFTTRWPNSASESNYASGRFPDPGWEGPKFWAEAGLIDVSAA